MIVLFLLLLMLTEDQSLKATASYIPPSPSHATLKGIPHHCGTSCPNVSSTIFAKPLHATITIFRGDIVDR